MLLLISGQKLLEKYFMIKQPSSNMYLFWRMDRKEVNRKLGKIKNKKREEEIKQTSCLKNRRQSISRSRSRDMRASRGS